MKLFPDEDVSETLDGSPEDASEKATVECQGFKIQAKKQGFIINREFLEQRFLTKKQFLDIKDAIDPSIALRFASRSELSQMLLSWGHESIGSLHDKILSDPDGLYREDVLFGRHLEFEDQSSAFGVSMQKS